MAENTDTPPSIPDFTVQIAALTAQVQENANKFLALEDENATLRRENRNLSERLSNMGNTVKWPRKTNNPDPKRDITKYCEFHGDHGHSTPDCISLRFEVADLLKRGHLQDLLSDKGKNTLAQREARRDEQPAEPTPERVVNVITGGSEVSGITYSAARRHARVAVNPETSLSPTPQTGASNLVLSFIDNEDSTLINPHHDALVVSLLIANCRIKRILIDNGSSTNVIFLSALKEMNIDEVHIHRRSTVLVGFSGEQKFTLGDITLPVYAAGVNLHITFVVLDSPSAYNVILGRPWIHDMRAVPSTFHQVIRFPTAWGVKEIKGEQATSRDCYRNTLRAKPSTL
ncbi:hypothetical protein UlMin_023983 [Ulmus minor]